MSRRRSHYSRNPYGGHERAREHIAQRRELSREFCGIDKDVEAAFFALPPVDLEKLLSRYKVKHGAKAADYASTTYAKWKHREVAMSGQTALRLLNLVPSFISIDARFDLIRKLRAHNITPTTIHLVTTPKDWRTAVVPAIDNLVGRSRLANLPKQVAEKATWLANDDSLAAIRMITAIEEQEARISTAKIDEEMQRISWFLAQADSARKIAHTIRLPAGTINITIKPPRIPFSRRLESFLKRRQFMDDKEPPQQSLVRTPQTQLTQTPGNLLDTAIGELSPEQVSRLQNKVIEEKIKLSVNEKEADSRFLNSSRDMANTLNWVNQMDRNIKTDYALDSKFNTASGNTDVHVKRNNNLLITVIAVVVAVLIVVLLMRR